MHATIEELTNTQLSTRGNGQRLTDLERAALDADLMSGQHTASELAAKYVVSALSIRRRCRVIGVELTGEKHTVAPEIAAAIAADIREGLSPAEIIRKHGVSRHVVFYQKEREARARIRLAQAKLKAVEKPTHRQWTDEEREQYAAEMAELYLTSRVWALVCGQATLEQIAEETGQSVEAIAQIAAKCPENWLGNSKYERRGEE